MGDISKHFSKKEFTCRCGCGFVKINNELIAVLEDVREHFANPVTVTSGCRCEGHNKSIGGAKTSQHTIGYAADIYVLGVLQKDLADYLNTKYPNKYGIGLYSAWVHIDVRNQRARW